MVLKQVVIVTGLAIVFWQITVQPRSLYSMVTYGKLTFRFDTLRYQLESPNKHNPLLGKDLRGRTVAEFPSEAFRSSSIGPCPVETQTDDDDLKDNCVQWGDLARLKITREKAAQKGGPECHTIEWSALSADFIPHDCISLESAYWYGGAEQIEQRWPSCLQTVDMKPFLAGDILQNRSTSLYGSVLGRMWISSTGVGLHVDEDVPLHASWNEAGDQLFCMKADYHEDGGVYPPSDNQLPVLKYTMCQTKNAVEAYSFMLRKFYKLPKGVPDKRMFTSPIWSTWAQYKMHVNLSSVVEYARGILDHNFTNSQLEIDDKWSTYYGDLTFDQTKFPNPRGMVDNLKKMGFRVTIWTTPFFNVDSQAFKEGLTEGYLVTDKRGTVPALVKWWQGIGGLLDVTNPAAVLWYQNNLKQFLRDTGVDSFKFDAGEVYSFMPRYFTTHTPLKNPGEYTTRYAEVVADLGGMVEMRSAYNSQEQPIFVRMMDKDSVWGYVNGLKTMIPTALLMGVLGYPFNLPDMIGGNGYPEETGVDGLERTLLPGRELFIRWVQLSAYLPSMQFSIAPWQYDDEVVQISQDMVRVHETVVAPLVLAAAEEATQTGAPIIRPLWWHDPEDEMALTLDSEFLVGSDLLVAPILEEGSRSRDIYLPRGKWKDNLKGTTHGGNIVLKGYQTRLADVATFSRLL